MPHLHCPDCYHYSFVKDDDGLKAAECPNCKFDLFAHYYEGRSLDEAKAFTAQETSRLLKMRKGRPVLKAGPGANKSRPIFTDTDKPSPTILGFQRNRFIALAILGLVATYWISAGFPNPVLFYSGTAKAECRQFADSKMNDLSTQKATKLEVGNTWLKKGHRVVELRLLDNRRQLTDIRLCVYGKGLIQIPGILLQHIWM